MYLSLLRKFDNGVQTSGTMKLIDQKGNVVLKFDTLELSYRDNERRISCIPSGVYVVKPKFSYRFGKCFELLNVLGRDAILIHAGNFHKDTHGCILIGNGYRDLNEDDYLDLLNSKIAMKNLVNTLKYQTTIKINIEWEIL